MLTDNKCVFCQIIKRKIPAQIVYEDELFLGFLDSRPLNPGHTLLIPKKHYRWVDDIPEFGLYFETAKKLAKAIRKAFQPATIFYLTMGFGVPHAHIHLVPKHEHDGLGEGILIKYVKKIPPEEMKKIQLQIKQNI